MTDRIDHAAEAEGLALEALSAVNSTPWSQTEGNAHLFHAIDPLVRAQLAQVHATLALVEAQRATAEQLRIATLVAIAHGTDGALSTVLRDMAYFKLGDEGVLAALGIEVVPDA